MAQGISGTVQGTSPATGFLLAGAVGVLALPSAVLAFSSGLDFTTTGRVLDSIGSSQAQLTSVGPVRTLGHGSPFHFTPAGTPERPERLLTVAVRVDPQIIREVIVQGRRAPLERVVAGGAPLQLSPTAFNLGVSRGYQKFAETAPKVDLRDIDMPDLASFDGKAPRPGTSRFSPRIAFDERQPVGKAPRTFAGEGEDRVDVGGALRLTRNLDVTAGVRLSAQDRDRLRPLTDGKQDNQAVYVGTQFRF